MCAIKGDFIREKAKSSTEFSEKYDVGMAEKGYTKMKRLSFEI